MLALIHSPPAQAAAGLDLNEYKYQSVQPATITAATTPTPSVATADPGTWVLAQPGLARLDELQVALASIPPSGTYGLGTYYVNADQVEVWQRVFCGSDGGVGA
jgi:hypothetical protein